jgi:CelD/BcsL family acetyltransferase involved in cellulose biosynthesis
MQFTLHQDFTEVSPSIWNALAAGGISDTPFARHEHLSLWWSTLGGGEWEDAELVLISASEDSQLIGLAPLFAAHHDGRRALLLLGSIEISDYLDLIVGGADLARFLAGLLDFLEQDPALRGLPLDWYNVPESSPSLTALSLEAKRRGWSSQQEGFRPTPRIALPADFESYLAALDKKQRHEVRRKMRRAAEGPTPSEFELVDATADLESEIDAFLGLMAQDPAKERFLSPAMREHMRGLMRRAAENGYLWMAFLTVDGTKAAAALNFDYNNKLWAYNSAVARDFMELSPGWVLLAHQIRWACEHGRHELDFMRGDEEYKYRFGASKQYVMRARLVPS